MKVTASKNAEQTRRKILEAAFEEFYKNGFQGGSLNRIVEGAGATKGASFHRFRGKNGLGYAVVSEVIQPPLKEQWSDPLALSSYPISDNLAQEMSPLDQRLRKSLEKVYAAWRESLAAAFACGIKAGTVRKNASPGKVAVLVVAAQTGIVGTAKKAQSEKLLRETTQVLFDYLDTLKP